jgi:hypothetical protein
MDVTTAKHQHSTQPGNGVVGPSRVPCCLWHPLWPGGGEEGPFCQDDYWLVCQSKWHLALAQQPQ